MTASVNKNDKEQQEAHPHDKLVKCALRNKAIAIDFFIAHWPEIGFEKQELSAIALSNNEHNEPGKPQTRSDVVYRGKVHDREYAYLTEHQSSPEEMLLRLLQYTVPILSEHIEQGRQGLPVVLPLCLYHNRRRKYPHPTTLDDYLGGEPHSSRSWLRYGFKLVDLTVMTDEEIATHGHAAILEWLLKDAFIPGEKLLARVKVHLKHPCYAAMGSQFESFKDAMYGYIIDVYKGKKTPAQIIDELSQVLPQERGIMLSAGQRLRQEGAQQAKQEERQIIAKNMLAEGADLQFVKRTTHLSDEELSHLH